MSAAKTSSYASAGVDIDQMASSLKDVKRMVLRTATENVHSAPGAFGGMFASPGKSTMLVASTDGVGTKLKVAVMAARHDTVGQDLVNHCVNDILVQGARPLFFLDYIGTAKLSGPVFKSVIKGICTACRQNGCALLGGETAEMPGLYPSDEYDLVGTIVGCVKKKNIINGATVRQGDVILGLHCTGLQTNGFSLARRILFDHAGLQIDSIFPDTTKSVADVLLDVHRSFLKPVQAIMQTVPVHGMAHITGGGLVDNLPRVLPDGLSAEIDVTAWNVPHVFRFLQKNGNVDAEEMYRVFNMGIGYTVILRAEDATKAIKALRTQRCRASLIGTIVRGNGTTSISGL